MLKRFIGRFMCLFFGHAPQAITFTFPRPGGAQRQELGDLQVVTLGNGLNTVAICINVCGRCNEPARHTAREGLMTEKIRGMIAGEAKAKADANAAEDKAKQEAFSKRQRGESIEAWRKRTKAKPVVAAVPPPRETPPDPRPDP